MTRKLLLVLCLFLYLAADAQPAPDSNLIPGKNTYQEAPDNMSRNMDSILRLQKERRAKEKRAAVLRISLGAAMLVILVIGLSRKRVKKS